MSPIQQRSEAKWKARVPKDRVYEKVMYISVTLPFGKQQLTQGPRQQCGESATGKEDHRTLRRFGRSSWVARLYPSSIGQPDILVDDISFDVRAGNTRWPLHPTPFVQSLMHEQRCADSGAAQAEGDEAKSREN